MELLQHLEELSNNPFNQLTKGSTMNFKKKSNNPDPKIMLRMLPVKLQTAIAELEADIDNDDVSQAAWAERAVVLSQIVKTYPKPIQNAFHSVVKLLADVERQARRAAGEEVPDAPKTKRNF